MEFDSPRERDFKSHDKSEAFTQSFGKLVEYGDRVGTIPREEQHLTIHDFSSNMDAANFSLPSEASLQTVTLPGKVIFHGSNIHFFFAFYHSHNRKENLCSDFSTN